MKKVLFALALLALAFSPMMVSQANAATVKHNLEAKHHRKLVKKHGGKHASRSHKGHHKAA